MEKRRIFFDIDREETWLNQMADQGYRLCGKSWWVYEFEKNESDGTYRYYVDRQSILKERENRAFCEFLGGMGIRLVTSQWGWHYFETPRENGFGALYTDGTSRIRCYFRMITFYVLLGIFCIGIINGSSGPYLFNLSIPLICNSVILLASAVMIFRYGKRILWIKGQQKLKEI